MKARSCQIQPHLSLMRLIIKMCRNGRRMNNELVNELRKIK